MHRIKQLLKWHDPVYRIISKTIDGEIIYLIQKRTGICWEYVKDSMTLGYDKRTVEYEAFYKNLSDAESRVHTEIDNDVRNKIITKVAKVYYADEQSVQDTHKLNKIINE